MESEDVPKMYGTDLSSLDKPLHSDIISKPVCSPIYTTPLTRIPIRIKLIQVRVNVLIQILTRTKVTRVSMCKWGL